MTSRSVPLSRTLLIRFYRLYCICTASVLHLYCICTASVLHLYCIARNRASLHTLRAVCARDGFVEDVPLIPLLNARSQLLDEWRAVVAIGHNSDAVSFHAMRDHVALKSPVAP